MGGACERGPSLPFSCCNVGAQHDNGVSCCCHMSADSRFSCSQHPPASPWFLAVHLRASCFFCCDSSCKASFFPFRRLGAWSWASRRRDFSAASKSVESDCTWRKVSLRGGGACRARGNRDGTVRRGFRTLLRAMDSRPGQGARRARTQAAAAGWCRRK